MSLAQLDVKVRALGQAGCRRARQQRRQLRGLRRARVRRLDAEHARANVELEDVQDESTIDAVTPSMQSGMVISGSTRWI